MTAMSWAAITFLENQRQDEIAIEQARAHACTIASMNILYSGLAIELSIYWQREYSLANGEGGI